MAKRALGETEILIHQRQVGNPLLQLLNSVPKVISENDVYHPDFLVAMCIAVVYVSSTYFLANPSELTAKLSKIRQHVLRIRRSVADEETDCLMTKAVKCFYRERSGIVRFILLVNADTGADSSVLLRIQREAIKFNYCVLMGSNTADIVAMLVNLASNANKTPHAFHEWIMRKKPTVEPQIAGSTALAALKQVYGVSSVDAIALMSHFKTLRKLFLATESELRQVKGIGAAKAALIASTFRASVS